MRSRDNKFGALIIVASIVVFSGIVLLISKSDSPNKEDLAKREWLKNTATKLEKRKIEIKTLENRFLELSSKFEGRVSRKERERLSKELVSLANNLDSTKKSFDTLLLEYNGRFSELNEDLKKDLSAPEKFEFKK